MRLKIKFRAAETGKKLSLPIHYQVLLQGLIYHSLDKDRDFQTFLHDKGYTYENRRFKLFTFSRLIGQAIYHKATRSLIFSEGAEWYVSSVLPEFIQTFGERMLLTEQIRVGGQVWTVESVEYRNVVKRQGAADIYMLSPITIYSTFEKEGGGQLTHYFQPSDEVFSHQLIKNALRKYEAFYKNPYTGSLDFQPVRVTRRDKVVMQYKKFIINAWNGSYRLTADPKMMNFLYSVGIGAKNSQGLGMFEFKA
ncbi:CRISPR-associated endoribonuclease Cas6 [Sporolactobacillus sp. THM7-7]|nr:CRISPR-associated endoribonuclease Cas6 [Sporolactobacillus sp. THM7-7]